MNAENSGGRERICPPKDRHQGNIDAQQGAFVTAEALILSSDTTCDVDCPGPQRVPRRLLGIKLPLGKTVCGKTGSAKVEPGWE